MEEDKKINNNSKRIRDDDDDESVSELQEAKRIRDSLLDESEFYLNDSENDQDQLVSVMRSFEEEISLPVNEVEISSSSLCGGSELTQPELLIDFLLEASDDELGLPPNSSSSSSPNEEERVLGEIKNSGDDGMLRVSSEAVGFDEQIWGFEDEISRSSTNFEFEISEQQEEKEEEKDSRDFDEFVNFEGLFDYCGDDDDVLSLCGISDFSDFSCRSESLPAL